MKCYRMFGYRATATVAALLAAAGAAASPILVGGLWDDYLPSAPNEVSTVNLPGSPLDGWERTFRLEVDQDGYLTSFHYEYVRPESLTTRFPLLDGLSFTFATVPGLVFDGDLEITISTQDGEWISTDTEVEIGPPQPQHDVFWETMPDWYTEDPARLDRVNRVNLDFWSGGTYSHCIADPNHEFWEMLRIQLAHHNIVPVPPAAGLILLGMAGFGLRRKFMKK